MCLFEGKTVFEGKTLIMTFVLRVFVRKLYGLLILGAVLS